ncbi:MAG TPA: hypothetical protein VGC54_02105 [Planctomycetota bacterium]
MNKCESLWNPETFELQCSSNGCGEPCKKVIIIEPETGNQITSCAPCDTAPLRSCKGERVEEPGGNVYFHCTTLICSAGKTCKETWKVDLLSCVCH